MATLKEQVQSDLAAIIATESVGISFTYSVDGQEYDAIRMSRQDVAIFGSGEGEENQYRFSLYVSAADLASPDTGAKVTIDSTTYRILRVEQDQLGAVWRLDCGQQYSGGW